MTAPAPGDGHEADLITWSEQGRKDEGAARLRRPLSFRHVPDEGRGRIGGLRMECRCATCNRLRAQAPRWGRAADSNAGHSMREAKMKKLTLDLDALAVDTFEVDERGRDGRGTVHAAGSTIPPYCITFTCGDSQIRPCQAD